MNEEHWNHDHAKSLAVFLNGRGLHSVGPKGEQIIDDSFYVIFNAYHEPLDYTMPEEKYGTQWTRILDTCQNLADEDGDTIGAGEKLKVSGRSVVVLHHPVAQLVGG